MIPAQRPDIRARLEALAECVIGDRVDKHLLRPTLIVALSTDVNDFVRYHPAEFAAQRVRDHEVLLKHPWFRRNERRRRRDQGFDRYGCQGGVERWGVAHPEQTPYRSMRNATTKKT